MKIKMEPITIIIVSILLGWGFTQMTDKPLCYVKEVKIGKEIIKPVYCEELGIK